MRFMQYRVWISKSENWQLRRRQSRLSRIVLNDQNEWKTLLGFDAQCDVKSHAIRLNQDSGDSLWGRKGRRMVNRQFPNKGDGNGVASRAAQACALVTPLHIHARQWANGKASRIRRSDGLHMASFCTSRNNPGVCGNPSSCSADLPQHSGTSPYPSCESDIVFRSQAAM